MAKTTTPTQTTAEQAPPADAPISLADAALMVGIEADQALDFRDHGSHITVVTVDGRKLRSDEVEGAAHG